MGLGVWFSEDIAHVLRGAGEGVNLLIAQRGLRDAVDVAYVAGYWAALRTVATSLGIGDCGLRIGDWGLGIAECGIRNPQSWSEGDP